MNLDDATSNRNEPSIPDRKSLMRAVATSPSFCLATGAGVGLLGMAPGTLGSLWGLPLAYAINHTSPWWIPATIILFLNLIGIPICTAGARRLGQKDPGAVVWDEIATIPMTFFCIPPNEMHSVFLLAMGFGLHRLFDISKFSPARQLESLPDGLGIMADDWAAGVYSCLALHGLRGLGLFG